MGSTTQPTSLRYVTRTARRGGFQARYGFVKGALFVAAIWAGWHVPTFWTIEGYRSMTLPVVVGGFGIGLACGSLVLAQVSNVTGGSILAAALWHLTYNMSAATAASRGLIGAVTTACVEVWAVALVLMAIRRRRGPSAISAAAA